MPNTLGLDDDLDGVELLQDLERIFDVQVSNEEATRMMTVGDLFDLLVRKIPPNNVDQKCTSAMAFYRLRRAIRDLGYGDAPVPSSDVRFLDQGNLRARLKNIEHASGLALPSVGATVPGCIGALIVLIAVPVLAYQIFPSAVSVVFGLLAGIIAGGAVLRYIDPGRLPKDCKTLGDLAQKSAALSFGRLAKEGGRHSDQDIWENLVEALSCYRLAKSEINRDTFFLQSQLKKAKAS
jgi:hypothetical protein